MRRNTMKSPVILSLIASALISVNAFATQTSVLNLVTTDAALNRVTYEQLQARGIDLSGVAIDKLGLTHDGDLFPRFIHDAAGDGVFGRQDYIDFIAEDVYNRYTDEAVYTLHIDTATVDDIKVISNSSLQHSSSVPADKGWTSVVKEEKNAYSLTTPNLRDPFYMDYVQATSSAVSKTFDVELPKLASNSADLTVSVRISGSSDMVETTDHHVVVRFNGQEVASLQFDGYESHTLTGAVSAGIARAGRNVVEVELPFDHSAPIDTVIVEGIDVRYERELTVDNNAINFTSTASSVLVSGLIGRASDQVVAYIKANDVIKRLDRLTEHNNGSVVINAHPNTENEYFVVKGHAVNTPLFRNVVENVDITSGEAQYLVIAHNDFINHSLDELVSTRAANYSTKVVDVEQIYAQYGRHTAEAAPIFEYIQYAVANLSTQMVLFVGGDTYDYHGYVSNSKSFIPTRYKAINGTDLIITHAPTDAAYGDVDEDGIPDIAIGRLPVRTAQELADVVAKIQQFEQRDYAGSAVFAADTLDHGRGYSFVNDAENVVDKLPEAMQADLTNAWQTATGVTFDSKKAYIEEDGLKQAKSKLISAINEGTELTSYLGHSNMFRWSSNLLNTADMAALTNAHRPTVMTQYGCWNTFFVMPRGNSLSHVAMLSGQNGAAAVLGSSTLSLASSEVALGQKLFAEMYTPGKTIGQALVDAKRAISGNASYVDVLLGWQIMGDPAIVMNPQ